MISLSAQSKAYVAIRPVDFRKGISGLQAVCEQHLKQDSMSGAFFLFRNKRMNSIKVLAYDGQGYWLMQKRLSRGRFPWWPESTRPGSELDYRKLQLIINAAMESQFSSDWKRVF